VFLHKIKPRIKNKEAIVWFDASHLSGWQTVKQGDIEIIENNFIWKERKIEKFLDPVHSKVLTAAEWGKENGYVKSSK